jgi:hypothetical protein
VLGVGREQNKIKNSSIKWGAAIILVALLFLQPH